MSTLSDALKIYNVYKTFNETAEPDFCQGSSPEILPPFLCVVSTKAHISWRSTVFYKHLRWLQKQKLRLSNSFKDTSFTARGRRQCLKMAYFGCRCWMWWSGYSSSISSRRGPYSRTYAICQSPPPDSRRMSSGDTTLTLSSSNLNHSSEGRQSRERKRHVPDRLGHPHVLQGSAPSYLLSSWPSPRSDPMSWSGLGVWAPPAGHSSRCCWSPSLQHGQTFR